MFNKLWRKRRKSAKMPSYPVSAPYFDVWTLRIVVITLSITTIGCAGGAIWLRTNGKQPPDYLLATLGTSAIAAMTLVLKPPSNGNDN